MNTTLLTKHTDSKGRCEYGTATYTANEMEEVFTVAERKTIAAGGTVARKDKYGAAEYMSLAAGASKAFQA